MREEASAAILKGMAHLFDRRRRSQLFLPPLLAVVPQQPSDLHRAPGGLDLLRAGLPLSPPETAGAHDADHHADHDADHHADHHVDHEDRHGAHLDAHLDTGPVAHDVADDRRDGRGGDQTAGDQVVKAKPFAGLGAALAAKPVAGAAVSFLGGAVLAGAAVHALG